MLTTVINGIIIMTHGKISEARIDRTCQPGRKALKKQIDRGGCKQSYGAIWCVQAAGIPLHTGSTKNQTTTTGTGTQESFYGKATNKRDQSSTQICKIERGVYRGRDDRSAGGLFQNKGTWHIKIIKEKYNCAMITTAFPSKRYRKSINSLFLKRSGLATNNQKR